MARKEAIFTATDGRDAGKQFLIREMPASRAEAWAIRAMLAMGRAGIEIPEAFRQQGFSGLLSILQSSSDSGIEIAAALLAGLKLTVFTNLLRIPADDAMPLLAEMMDCAQRMESAVTRALVEDDIEEIQTRLKLRSEIWNLHTDFFGGAGQSTSGSEPPAQPASSLTIKPRKQSAR